MNPTVKYTLGRIGLFLLVFLVLWPVQLNILIKLMIAVLFSAALSFFLLRGLRDQVAEQLASRAGRRRTDKDRLRAALSGEDETTPEPDQGSAASDSTEPTSNEDKKEKGED